ncbi:MAG TPA: YidC/Oxa1 family membrane protein insertase, partial [Patescibacteria group bacterium]
MNILIAPFVNGILAAYYLFGNLGWAIILVTVVIRLVLLPLVIPSLKSGQKMRELQPKLKRLQEKYKNDKEGLAKAQMEMYKQEGVSPLSGCLPQLLQVAVLIIFFSAFNIVTNYTLGKVNTADLNRNLISTFQVKEGFKFQINFLGSDLTRTPKQVFGEGVGLNLLLPLILLLGSGYLQYIGAKLMMPTAGNSTNSKQPLTGDKKPVKIDDTAYTKETP